MPIMISAFARSDIVTQSVSLSRACITVAIAARNFLLAGFGTEALASGHGSRRAYTGMSNGRGRRVAGGCARGRRSGGINAPAPRAFWAAGGGIRWCSKDPRGNAVRGSGDWPTNAGVGGASGRSVWHRGGDWGRRCGVGVSLEVCGGGEGAEAAEHISWEALLKRARWWRAAGGAAARRRE